MSCCDVLRALVTAIPIEAANTMGIPDSDPLSRSGEPPIWADFRQILQEGGVAVALEPISRWDFYEAASSPRHVLTIQTADQALYANLLLTIGVRKPSE